MLVLQLIHRRNGTGYGDIDSSRQLTTTYEYKTVGEERKANGLMGFDADLIS